MTSTKESGTPQIGGDLIASLSLGLYTDPLDVYRELVQNAVDAYQESGMANEHRRIDIQIDRTERRIVVRDHALGLSKQQMSTHLFSVGNSSKRGKKLRGFRGIGRFAALGYCKKLIFRSRKSKQDAVTEITWDSLALHEHLSGPNTFDLGEVLKEISDIHSPPEDDDCPDHFFECVMEGVRPSRNDVLLNHHVVARYLSEVAPVPFHEDFSYRTKISDILDYDLTYETQISVNGSPTLTRPHRDHVIQPVTGNTVSTISGVKRIDEIVTSNGSDHESVDVSLAQGWVLEHDYPGALPQASNVRGLRIRVGNIQVGDERILEHLFREERFNVWCIGEIHICSTSIRPNTRRDNLELSPKVDDLENSLQIVAEHLSGICRKISRERSGSQKTAHMERKLKDREYKSILKQLAIEKPYPEKITLTSIKPKGAKQ